MLSPCVLCVPVFAFFAVQIGDAGTLIAQNLAACNINVTTEKDMIRFDKTKQGIQIRVLVGDDKGGTHFMTLMKSNGKETLIDEVISNSLLFKDSSKYQFFNVFDFTVREKRLFIFYNDFGQIFMDAYTLDTNIVETKKRYFIGRFGMISYENGGGMNSVCSESWINGTLYFHVNARQNYGGYLNELFVFKNDTVKKIVFAERKSLIVLKSVAMDERSGKEWYEANLNSTDKKEDIDRLNLLSKYYNVPFGYYRMSANNDAYATESSYLRKNGLEEYKFPWIRPEGKESDIVQKEKTASHIHDLLSRHVHFEINKIDLLGYISCTSFRKYDCFGKDSTKIKHFTISFNGDMLYFFVSVNSLQLCILRCNQSSNDWLFSDYTEEEIKMKDSTTIE